MPDSPLVIENLSFQYRTRPEPAIEDISFELKPGEMLLIAGSSGCGKTTVLRLIDLLQQEKPVPFGAIAKHTGADPQGLRFLLELLSANRIIDMRDDAASLHPSFVKALPFRDLLETKLQYAGLMLGDFAGLFTAMVANPQDLINPDGSRRANRTTP